MKIKHLIKKFLICFFSCPFVKVNNKKIVFDNFLGKGYGCNPKYIAEELIRENIDCEMVWLVKDLNESMPQKIRKVKYASIRGLWELATAKVWIDNVRNTKYIRKKKNQFYIQTWHATIGIKKVEAQIEKFLNPIYVKNAKIDGRISDLMLSNNAITTKIFKNDFWYNGEVLECGFPRNDILYNVTSELRHKVYEYFNIDLKKKIVIYAPTFRKDKDLKAYFWEFEKCCSLLNERFSEEYIMLVRLHPNIAELAKDLEYNDRVINATDYSDIQELLAVSDVGITDYSSICFDMSMVNKPVFLVCKDLDTYKSSDQGFYFELEDLPFDIATSEEELYEKIRGFDNDEYKARCKKFYDDINLINISNSANKVVEIIKEKIGA